MSARHIWALAVSIVTATAFTIFAVVTTQVHSVRAGSPWQDDPYDGIVSFTQFLVPTLTILIVVRMFLGLSASFGLRLLLKAALVSTVLVTGTTAADALAVLVGADRQLWNERTHLLVLALVPLAVGSLVSFVLLALAFRKLPAFEPSEGDWLDELPMLADVLRRNIVTIAAIGSLVASLLVITALAIGEGGLDPLLFVTETVIFGSGLFAFCMVCNKVLRIAVTSAPESRLRRAAYAAIVGAAAGIPLAGALRDSIWLMLGHDSPVHTTAQLAEIAAGGAVVFGLATFLVVYLGKPRRWIRVALAIVLVLAAYPVILLVGRAQPLALPAPTGRYPVGRTITEWTDHGRTDPLAPHPGTPRELSVWLWYPATSSDRPTAPYAPGAWSQLHFAPPIGLLQGSFGVLETHSVEDAPAAKGHFPAVVLEPGMGLSAPQFSTLAENIASHGYLVAGITPTYSANLSVLHGQPVTSTPTGNPDDPDAAKGARLVDIWAADARYVATRLGGPTVYIGHSFGGASALQACHLDAHCGGAVDLDGTQFASVTRTGLRAPMMLMGSENSCVIGRCRPAGAVESGQLATARTMLNASTGPKWCYSITGTQHFNFTDYAAYYLAPPVSSLIPLGPIDGDRGLTIDNAYVIAFLDHVAHGTTEPLLSGPSDLYPEVR